MILFKSSSDDFFSIVGDKMILIMPDNINQIKDNIKYYDGVILSIDKYSVNSRYTLSIDEIKDIIKIIPDKEVFISINKNIENNELDEVESILVSLNELNIKGVLYGDVALVTYKDKLNYDLVWAQEHLVTNYETINYWCDLGIKYAYLSSDLNINEISIIARNAKSKLMVNLFGYNSMFVSKRHIVKNYLKNFNIKDNSKIHYMKKEGKIYPIVDANYTYVFANNIFNGIKEYYNMDVDYYVVNGFLIDNEKLTKVLSIIGNITKENVEDYALQVMDSFANIDTGFLYKDVVSKVKK